MKKISIIVPVYNAEKYLHRCIDSILNQTFDDFELILVNDGSKDSSGAICEEYAKKDGRIVVIHKENGGQSTARNMALDIAQGEYFGFVDSDDYIEPEMYEKMYIAIKETNANVAMCGSFWVSPDYSSKTTSLTLKTQTVWSGEELKKNFLTTFFPGTSVCDKLFDRKLFNGDKRVRFPHGYICEDVPVSFEIMYKCDTLVHIGEPCYNYYQRQGSTSRGSFSEKTYGLIKYPREIRNTIYQKYNYLAEEADYFYSLYILNFLILMDPKCAKSECKKYRKELLSYKKAFLKYAPKQQKRLFNLFRFNLFYFLRKIKRIFK